MEGVLEMFRVAPFVEEYYASTLAQPEPAAAEDGDEAGETDGEEEEEDDDDEEEDEEGGKTKLTKEEFMRKARVLQQHYLDTQDQRRVGPAQPATSVGTQWPARMPGERAHVPGLVSMGRTQGVGAPRPVSRRIRTARDLR